MIRSTLDTDGRTPPAAHSLLMMIRSTLDTDGRTPPAPHSLLMMIRSTLDTDGRTPPADQSLTDGNPTTHVLDGRTQRTATDRRTALETPPAVRSLAAYSCVSAALPSARPDRAIALHSRLERNSACGCFCWSTSKPARSTLRVTRSPEVDPFGDSRETSGRLDSGVPLTRCESGSAALCAFAPLHFRSEYRAVGGGLPLCVLPPPPAHEHALCGVPHRVL
jgi:hypothetical protein